MHSMFSKALPILLGVLLGYIGGMLAISHADGLKLDAPSSGLRIEASIGKCKYGRAGDGTWYKDGYPQQIQLSTNCGSLGVSQTPFQTPLGNLGYRIAYVDFGTARADTYVPLIDSEANSFPSGQNCNQQTFSGCVGQFKQWGRARGISIGPVIERQTSWANFGLEGGGFFYHSDWHVNGVVPGPGTCPTCGPAQEIAWNRAAGNHATWYVGATVERAGIFLQARRYQSTYASQAKVDPGNIGLIAGPLWSVQLGYQWRLN